MKSPDRPLEILLVDDHAMVREGLAGIIRADPRLRVAGCAGSCREASALFRRLAPDVVVIDFRLPDGDGIGFIRSHAPLHPGVRWIVLTMHKNPAIREEALRAGAHDFVVKDLACEDLIASITGTTAPLATCPGLLSSRERQVLAAVVKGMTSKEIAAELGVSVKTVETYRERLMRKSGARNAAELTRHAIEIGLD